MGITDRAGAVAERRPASESGYRLVLQPPFRQQGLCWVAPLTEIEKAVDLAAVADNDESPERSTLQFFENGNPLGPPHTAHPRIRLFGGGAFSHWKEALYFSTRDGSDPNLNGRAYEIVITPAAEQPRPPAVAIGQTADPSTVADPKTPDACLEAARGHVGRRQWTEAIPHLEELIGYLARFADAKPLLARAYEEAGRLEEADRAYSELAALAPAEPGHWQALARIRKKLKNWLSAYDACSRLLALRPEDGEARWELASACWEAGLRDEAREQVDWILARNPDHRGALTVLARHLFATEPDRSLECWSRLATMTPTAFEPHLQVARLHLQARREAEAEAAFRTVLVHAPVHPEALGRLALIVGRRDPEEALGLLTRWSAASPADAGPWIALAELYILVEKPEEAQAAIRQGLQRKPDDIDALTQLGRILSDTLQHDEALEIWRRLADLTPQSVEPKVWIARILLRRQDPHAEQALQMVLAVAPAHGEALRSLAQWYERDDASLPAALDTWERLAAAEPGSVFALIERGRLLERYDRIHEAEEDYRRAVLRAPHDTSALATLTDFHCSRQRWDDAIRAFQDHLELAPGNFEAMLGLSACLQRVGRFKEAEDLYERAMAIEPKTIEQLLYRGRLLRSLGHTEAAVGDFRKVCALERTNSEAWRNVVVFLAKLEREAEALAALDQAELALGSEPASLVVLGRAAATAQFDARAVEYYRRAIESDPQEPAGHAALGMHYFERGIVDGAFHHLLDSRVLDPSSVPVARALFDTTNILRMLGHDHVQFRHEPRSIGKILVPERLFELVMRKTADGSIAPYDPEPRRVIAVTSSLAGGGAERQLALMMQGLSDRAYGFDLALFAVNLSHRTGRDFFLPLLTDRGIDIVEVDDQATDCLGEPEVEPFFEIIRHFPPEMAGPIAFWLREFRRRRPAVVHAWQDSINLMAGVAALLAGVPRIVLCTRSIRPDNPRRRLQRFMQEGYQTILSHPSIVLSNNSRAGAADYADWLGLKADQIEVVYNGIDCENLERDSDGHPAARIRRELGIPSAAQVVGGVFRMSEEKRPLLWLEAAALVARQCPGVHFLICGDGPMRKEIEDRAEELAISHLVHLPGAQANIGAWFKAMDVILLASRHEGLPNVLLEAQSLGVPVVAPDVGGMSEVVEHGVTGWVIPDADAAALAERLAFCLSDEAWRDTAAEAGPRFVRDRFGIETMLSRNLEIYGISAVTDHRPRRRTPPKPLASQSEPPRAPVTTKPPRTQR